MKNNEIFFNFISFINHSELIFVFLTRSPLKSQNIFAQKLNRFLLIIPLASHQRLINPSPMLIYTKPTEKLYVRIKYLLNKLLKLFHTGFKVIVLYFLASDEFYLRNLTSFTELISMK